MSISELISYNKLKEDYQKSIFKLSVIKNTSHEFEVFRKQRQHDLKEQFIIIKDELKLYIGRLNNQYYKIKFNVTEPYLRKQILHDLESIELKTTECAMMHVTYSIQIFKMIKSHIDDENKRFESYSKKQDCSEDLFIDLNFNKKKAAKKRSNNHADITTDSKIKDNDIKSAEKVFIFSVLKANQNFKCNGCGLNLLPFNNYLNHEEEDPMNSGKYYWVSYHVNRDCLNRKFKAFYLSKIPVVIKFRVKNAEQDLMELGFYNIKDESTNFSATNAVGDEIQVMNEMNVKTKNLTNDSQESAFIFSVLKFNQHFKCCGCNLDLKAHSMYLNHKEDNPKFPGKFVWKSYHADSACLLNCGFDISYLNKTPVLMKVFVKNGISTLKKIGFNVIHDESIGQLSNETKIIKANIKVQPSMETKTGISNNSPGSREDVFIYNVLNINQNFKCFGCNVDLTPQSNYLNHKEEFSVIPGKFVWKSYHVSINCLSKRGFGMEYLNRTPVIIKVTNEKAELILKQMGFNEIRNEAKNKDKSKKKKANINKSIPSKIQKAKSTENYSILANEKGYLFNTEPFIMVFEAPKFIRCEACHNFIISNDVTGNDSGNVNTFLSLSHKEVVPRDKRLEEYFRTKKMDPPATSQYYHAKLECLHSRGFTNAFLNHSKCILHESSDKVLTKTDKKKIRKALLECNFSAANIIFDDQTSSVLENASNNSNSTLTIDKKNDNKKVKSTVCQGASNSTNSYFRICKYQFISHLNSNNCWGCRDMLQKNGLCIIYSRNSDGCDYECIFHLNPNCIKNVFNDAIHLRTIPCYIDTDISVNKKLIIECGLEKVIPSF